MELKDYLTNEVLSKRFNNQFDLVNYTIKLAEEMIHAGRGPRVKTDTENPAMQILEEILAGKDQLNVETVNSKEKTPVKKFQTIEKEPIQFEESQERV